MTLQMLSYGQNLQTELKILFVNLLYVRKIHGGIQTLPASELKFLPRFILIWEIIMFYYL